jgi:hypothetical protein
MWAAEMRQTLPTTAMHCLGGGCFGNVGTLWPQKSRWRWYQVDLAAPIHPVLWAEVWEHLQGSGSKGGRARDSIAHRHGSRTPA